MQAAVPAPRRSWTWLGAALCFQSTRSVLLGFFGCLLVGFEIQDDQLAGRRVPAVSHKEQQEPLQHCSHSLLISLGQDLEAMVVYRPQLADIPWDPMSCECSVTVSQAVAMLGSAEQMGAGYSEPEFALDHCFDPTLAKVEACLTEPPPPYSILDVNVAQHMAFAAFAVQMDGCPEAVQGVLDFWMLSRMLVLTFRAGLGSKFALPHQTPVLQGRPTSAWGLS